MKSLLIDKYGESICFTYSKKKQDSQMFFSANVKSVDMAEQLRSVKVTAECGKIIRRVLQKVDFGLERSFCDGNDVSISYNTFLENRPEEWMDFCSALADQKTIPFARQRIFDTVFQILYKIIHVNRKRTPFSIAWAQAIHDVSRSSHLIDMACRLGLAVSYDEVQRIDMGIVQRTIESCGEHRVPVRSNIKSNMVIHAATDNFDRNDRKGGSHDTILMFFQTSSTNEEETSGTVKISSRPDDQARQRRLPDTLPCQNLIKVNRGHFRATIPADYKVCEISSEVTVNEHDFDYELWQLVRYTADTLPAEGSTVSTKYAIPSYSSINSLLSKVKVELTSIGFASILPYPATDFDAIHTTMINFQDVLEQKDLPYGVLWCDEGVYRIAKELQFLFSEKFKNIFIGLGGFHTEKVLLACCGIYLKDIGARDIFVTNEIYGPLVTENAILNGKDYVQSREAMRNLAESVNRVSKNSNLRSWNYLSHSISLLLIFAQC